MGAILDAVVPLFSLIILGFIAGKRRWIDASGVKALVGFIFNIAMPALLFRLVVTSDVAGLIDLRFLFCHVQRASRRRRLGRPARQGSVPAVIAAAGHPGISDHPSPIRCCSASP